MKMLRPQIFNFLFVVLLVACSNESVNNEDAIIDQFDASKAYEAKDFSYGDHPRQILDIYLPPNRTNATKVVILIHGGSWTSGDKSSMEPIELLIRNDIPDLAIVNINYRLADNETPPFPMQLNDITAVIEYLKANKEQYSISEDIGFIGTSAGGHLAMLWSYAYDDNNKVDMVCSIVGPTNFTDPAYLNSTDSEIQELLGAFGNVTINFLEEVSPFHQVKASSPPTILFYGGQDPLIPTSQGVDLKNKLESLDVPYEFTLYENAGHGWTGLELLDTWSKLKLFSETYL